MSAAAANLVTDKFCTKMINSIAKVMNSIAKATNSIAKAMNSIAKVTIYGSHPHYRKHATTRLTPLGL